MPILSLDALSLSGLAWTFKLLPSKNTETSMTCWAIYQYTIIDKYMVSLDNNS